MSSYDALWHIRMQESTMRMTTPSRRLCRVVMSLAIVGCATTASTAQALVESPMAALSLITHDPADRLVDLPHGHSLVIADGGWECDRTAVSVARSTDDVCASLERYASRQSASRSKGHAMRWGIAIG